MPGITVKHVNGTTGILRRGKENGTIAAGAIIWAEGDVCTKDGACATKEILEVLPADAIWELDQMDGLGRMTNDKITYVSYEQLGARIPEGSVEGRV